MSDDSERNSSSGAQGSYYRPTVVLPISKDAAEAVVDYFKMDGVEILHLNSHEKRQENYLSASTAGSSFAPSAFLKLMKALDEFNTEIAIQPTPRPIPGASSAMSALSFVFTRKYYERVFLPIFQDEQVEYQEAYAEGATRKAQWIRARLWLLIGMALWQSGLSEVFSFLKFTKS